MRAIASLPRGLHGATFKGHRAGTHRLVSPEETLERVRPLLPGMGITRVANVTGLDSLGVPVVMVCRPNSRNLAVSQGKGLTLAAAKASGIMESVEAYHAERIALPLLLGSYEELRATHRVVDVAHLTRPKQSAFHPHLPLLWIEGQDLLQGEPVLVPYETVHVNFTLPALSGEGCFVPGSNGLASGNHLLEAISHGICELVERDALTLWGLASQTEREESLLDPRTVTDPDCRQVLDRVARAGVEARFWEITSDVGIPAFACDLTMPKDRGWRSRGAGGFGCHPSRPVALLRALTEAAQSWMTAVAGSRDDITRVMYERSRPSDRPGGNGFDTSGRLRSFAEGPGWEAETFEEDVRRQLECLRRAGMERVVVIDLTRPEIGLSVVKVVIPRLEFSPQSRAAFGQRALTKIAMRQLSSSLLPGMTSEEGAS